MTRGRLTRPDNGQPESPSLVSFLSPRAPVCPKSLLLCARAKLTDKNADKKDKTTRRIALAGGESETALAGALAVVEAGLAEVLVLGEANKARALAERQAIDLAETPGVTLLDCPSEQASARAASMANAGEVQVVMKGSVKTDAFMRALLQREGGIRVSGQRMVHVFYITPPSAADEEDANKAGGVFLSDCAVNVKPDEATRRECLRAVVSLSHGVGIVCPKIAILSAVEKETESVPSSVDAGALARWGRETFKGRACIEGPLSLDVALAEQAVRVKGIEGSEVAGRANGMIVADIDVGNVLFKSFVWLGGGCSAGVVVGGRCPVVLTSRADAAAARLASVALAVIATEN